jgi:UDP-glucose 4-epimerase
VTGGAGFIGSHLCDALLERGQDVVCVDDLVGTGGTTRNVEHLLDDPRFELVTEDVVEWATGGLAGVDCLFHLAASKNSVCREDPERDLAVNALGTLRLLRAAARDGVAKVVHASTGSVFGESGRRHGVDTPTRPVGYYGVSKLAAESYCRMIGDAEGLNWTILRYYHVIGPRQDGSDTGGVLPIFVRRALAGLPLTIDGDGLQTRSFTSVHDVVRANLLALASSAAARQTYNCASGLRVTVAELAAEVLAQTGSSSTLEYGPARPGDIRDFDVDNHGLRDLGLDFDTDWRATVGAVVAAEAAAPAV